jgi:hypothetical protein
MLGEINDPNMWLATAIPVVVVVIAFAAFIGPRWSRRGRHPH